MASISQSVLDPPGPSSELTRAITSRRARRWGDPEGNLGWLSPPEGRRVEPKYNIERAIAKGTGAITPTRTGGRYRLRPLRRAILSRR